MCPYDYVCLSENVYPYNSVCLLDCVYPCVCNVHLFNCMYLSDYVCPSDNVYPDDSVCLSGCVWPYDNVCLPDCVCVYTYLTVGAHRMVDVCLTVCVPI